jgi:MFS family permease
MIAPALPSIRQDLCLSPTETQITFSIFILGLAFAPFLIGPASEVFGRKPLWLGCNVFYIVWNSLCPVGTSGPMLVVGRFLAGSGASVGITLTGPIMADMFRAKDRGKSLAVATVFPYLGPALGPIVGGAVSQHVSWPWLFWVLSIFDAAVVMVGWVVVKESYTPVLVRRLNQSDAAATTSLVCKLRPALLRPIRLLLTRPIVPLLSLVMGAQFGIYTLALSIYATIFIDNYHQSPTTSSLHYIAIALGATIASQAGGHLTDLIYRRLKVSTRDGIDVAVPEYRIPMLAFGTVLVPIGLLWLGWSIASHQPWIMVDIGAAIFSCGGMVVGSAVLAYLLDEFTTSAASANAAARCMSNVLGFAFPLFAPEVFNRLGYGWGCSVLALAWVVLATPVCVGIWVWGSRLRAVGRSNVE